jgi:hypothetical protein
MEQRLQEMEKRFQEQEAAKTTLEGQLSEIGKQLKEEHEKVILQSLKAKEEEALSSRVEHQIREMQEKLRRDKHEQEILESRGKAESQLKDLERRLAEERESWMSALKNQLKERELIEQDVEHNLSRKLRDVEQRYQDEKIQWMTSVRQKDEEITQGRRQSQQEIERLKEALETKDEFVEEMRETAAEQRRAVEREAQAEMRTLQGQLDGQMRDNGTLRAQLALLQTQLQQSESQRQEESTRARNQFTRLEQEHTDLRKRLEAQMTQREEEAKRTLDDEMKRLETQGALRVEELRLEHTRRSQEQTQHWEGLAAQTRSEKETLKHALLGREEELSRLQAELAEQRRVLETERNRFGVELEKNRKTAHDDAMASLQDILQERLAVEYKKWDEQSQAAVEQAKAPLLRALEAQKALTTNLEAEGKRAVEDIQMLREQGKALAAERDATARSLEDEKVGRENQTRQFMQQLAEKQMRESALREEMDKQTQQWQAVRQEWQTRLETLAEEWNATLTAKERAIAVHAEAQKHALAELDKLRSEKTELEVSRTQLEESRVQLEESRTQSEESRTQAEAAKVQAEKELSDLRLEISATAQRQRELESVAGQLRDELKRREQEWAEKEKVWQTAKVEWEKTMVDLEKARAAAAARPVAPMMLASTPAPAASSPAPVSPEAAKALMAIKQQMQEMQTLLTWLRPSKKLPLSKAA